MSFKKFGSTSGMILNVITIEFVNEWSSTTSQKHIRLTESLERKAPKDISEGPDEEYKGQGQVAC